MPLVEIIMGEKTADEALARALDFVKADREDADRGERRARLLHQPRLRRPMSSRAWRCCAEGVKPALIENAGLQAGMPVGPLALTDEVSAELVCKVDRQAAADLGAAYQSPAGMAVAQTMVGLGRIGKKAGQGFYDYPPSGKKALWPGLTELFPVVARQPDLDELVQRLINIQSLETARCMEEGVLTRAQDADVGSVLGWGFPAFRGGTLSHIHSVGLASFVQQCDDAGRQIWRTLQAGANPARHGRQRPILLPALIHFAVGDSASGARRITVQRRWVGRTSGPTLKSEAPEAQACGLGTGPGVG